MGGRRGARALVLLLALVAAPAAAPRPAASPASELLDGEAVLQRQGGWWDNRDWDWYLGNVPILETPDPEIDATYYYRWEVVTKHLVYGSPEHGYTFTEFTDRPFWAGRYGAISCPLGHQLYEVRWLKDRRIVEDFAHYWFDVPGAEPRSYSNWYGDAVWAAYRVNGDRDFLLGLLPHMKEQLRGWMREHWDPAHGMFRWDGMHDGMETNINSRQTPEWFDGAEGYRPTLNSYLWADLRALARAAAVAGDEAGAAEYARRAADLKARIQEELWDPERQFFFPQFAWQEETVAVPWPGESGERAGEAAVAGASGAAGETPPIEPFSLTYESGPWAGDPHGRELIGYVPWQFGLPDPGHETAWRFLMDPERFWTRYGPTTVEQGDPLFYVSPRCCVWSGNSWPYATTQTLTAMARLLQDYDQDVVDADDWFRALQSYSRTQRKGGRPYVAEAADPYTGSWEGHDKIFHSEHYFHSAYVDLVLSGLMGLRPRADDVLVVDPLAPADWDWFAVDGVEIHGHDVSLLWDRDGSRYGRGPGFRVFVNGSQVATADRPGRLEVSLPPPPERPSPSRPANHAVSNGSAHHPFATASSSRPEHVPSWAVNGQYRYHLRAPDRWVPDGDGGDDSWLAVDFGAERSVQSVKLYLLDDTVAVTGEPASAGGGPAVAAPASYRLEARTAAGWELVDGHRHPGRPSGRRANVVTFPEPVRASALRVVLEHAPGTVAGLSELEAWGPGEPPVPPTAPVGNVALNRTGVGLPRVEVSGSAEGTDPTLLNDGLVAFNHYTHRAWRAAGRDRDRDWIEVDLGRPRSVDGVDLYLWSWPERGVAAPRSWRLQVHRHGVWEDVRELDRRPTEPRGMARNRLTFEAVRARRLRIWLEHDPAAPGAASELRVWEAGSPR